MFIDTHCHIDSYEHHANESFDSLLARLAHAPDENVTLPEAFIHVACDPADFERGKELSEKYPNVYTAYGIHPEYVLTETAEDEARLVEYLKHPKCIACGEFGLDYHYDREHREQQLVLFERHLKIGIESNKPLVLHLREADDDALAVLRSADLRDAKIHVHCFTGSPKFCAQLLDLKYRGANIFVGFTGIITFKNAQNVRDAAALVPLDQILLETDSPYMSPIPYRGKPCHSGYIPYIVKALAQTKQTSVEELYKVCRANTNRCYGI
jgi:TatD DNase family protein